MRRIDKKLNMMKANLLAESRYLESKELLTEVISGPQKTDSDIEELADDIFKRTQHLIPDMKAVYDAQKELINDTAKGNKETRDRLYDVVGALTSRAMSKLRGLSEEEIGNESYDFEKDAFLYNDEEYKIDKLIGKPKIDDNGLEVEFSLAVKKMNPEKGVYWEPINGRLIYKLKGKQTGRYEIDKDLEDELTLIDSNNKHIDAKNLTMPRIGYGNGPLINGIRFYVNTKITKIWRKEW